MGSLKFDQLTICSAKREEFIVQPDDCMSSPSIVDLKRIPNCAHLVVGWNGFGEFCLWYVLFHSSKGLCVYNIFPERI